MKTTTHFFNRFLLVAALCIGLSIATSRGHDGGSGNSGGGDKNFEVELAMMPTADAPPNSSVRLSFEADDEDGVQTAELKLDTRNLPAATYTVAVTLKSNGSSVVIGTFTVDNEGEGEIEFGHEGNPFPANVDPQDIASVTVSGVNGVVLFKVDLSSLTSATSMNISVSKEAVAGAAVPNATGNISVTGFLSHGRVKGSLQLIGHGLPPNTQVAIAVNGVAIKSLRTSKTGDVKVKLSPQGKTGTLLPGVTLAGITSVAIIDRNGNVLLQVNL